MRSVSPVHVQDVHRGSTAARGPASQSTAHPCGTLQMTQRNLPDGSGVSCTEAIRGILPDVRVLVLTVSERDRDLFSAIKAGARGYVLKHISLSELTTALNLVAAGEAIISPVMAARLMQEFQSPAEAVAHESEPEISGRELEVLRMVAGGYSNREIGASLFIAEATVKAHLRSILERLHVRNRAQAVAIATARGILRAG